MENSMELWKKIPNFSRYEVSSLGRVRSLNYKRSGKVVELKPAISTDGYLKTVFLSDTGKYTSTSVHRMVAIAFLGFMENMQVNHKNGVKTDNRIDNLEWCTSSENCQHSFDIGLQKPKRGELNGMAKLTQKQVDAARKQKLEGGRYWGRNELAKKLGIAPKHLQKIVNNTNIW